MSWFKRKPKVEFLCALDVATVQYPIVEATKLRPSWFDAATSEYAKTLVANKNTKDTRKLKNVTKCPGIRKFLKSGWIVRTYQDIHLTVKGDEFTWATPLDQNKFYKSDLVAFHDFDSFSKCPHLKEKTPILKIVTPWFVKLPKGYNMLQLPLSYWDESRFTTATGIYEREFGFFELNIQLLWQGGDGEFLIKAGTPIAHLLLIDKTDSITNIRKATLEELNDLDAIKHVKSSRFCANYSDIKDSIKEIFNRSKK